MKRESQRQREMAIQTQERETNLKKQKVRGRKEWQIERSRVKVKMKTNNHHHWPTPPAEARYRNLNVFGALSAPTWWTAAQLISLPSQWWQTSSFFPHLWGGRVWEGQRKWRIRGDKFIISGPNMIFNKKHFKFRRFSNRKNHWIVIPYVKKSKMPRQKPGSFFKCLLIIQSLVENFM